MNLDHITDHIHNAAAGAAVTSPWWLPWLQQVSERAAIVLPILGCTWFAIQITSKLISWVKKDNDQ
jgi:hypothetical protein